MATASVSIKMSTEEYKLLVDALVFYRDSKAEVAKDERIDAKLRHNARGIAVQAENLFSNLKRS